MAPPQPQSLLSEELRQIHDALDGKVSRYATITIVNETKYDLEAEGTTERSGCIQIFPEKIEGNSSDIALWVKHTNTVLGACGVVHYTLNGQTLNIMVSVPHDRNLYSTWCNVSLSRKKQTFFELYNNNPIKAGNWGEVTFQNLQFKFMMTNRSKSDMILHIRYA
jgi:hypothetical protein